MTAPGTGTDWDDERLDAAFVERAARVTVPSDIVVSTIARLQPAERQSPWARLLPAAAALVLVVGLVGGGIAMLAGPGGLTGNPVTFRDGPTPDLRTLDAGTFALDFPAAWQAEATSGAVGSGGSVIAVLSNQPVEERCRGTGGLDVNCVYEQRLEPGAVRIFVGTGGYRGQTIFDRSDIENGTTTRAEIGGMPAILDEYDVTPDDYYLADQSAAWQIALPTSLSNVVRLEFMARDPDADAARAAVDEIAASFRFTPPPTPLPADLEHGASLGRTMLDAQAASFRQGYVRPDDVDSVTYLDCLPPTTGEDRVVLVQYGPGGDLGWNVLVRCRWMVNAGDDGPFWRIDAVYEWTAGESFGRYRESYWIDATGAVVAITNSGEVPPAGDPSATPTPSPVGPDGTVVITLGAPGDIATRDVRIVDRTSAFVSARPATSAERAFSTGDIPDGTLGLIDLPDGGMLIRWDGSLCDDGFILVVDAIDGGAVPDRLTLFGERGGACRSMRVSWAIRLDFSVDVGATTVLGRNFVGATAVTPPSIPPARPLPWPGDNLGLEVIDVEAALEIQAMPGDDREIAVRGWIWRLNPATLDCFVFEGTDVEELFFGEGCRSDSLMASVDGTFDDATLPLAIGQASTGSLPFGRRVEVVLIGHFDDRRSGGCSAAPVKRCADMFWVDGVSLDGMLAPRDWADAVRGGSGPTYTHDQAWDRVRGPEADPLIPLSIGQIIDSTLAKLEPATAGVVPVEMWNWHITAFEPSSGRLRTFVIPDSVLGNHDGVVSYEVDGDDVLVSIAVIN